MVLLPDVNVLLAGVRADHDHHRRARAFLDEARSASDMLGLSDSALASVVRLATNARVFVLPDTAPSSSRSTAASDATPASAGAACSTSSGVQ
jgi:predicted nucleic acid-binding protein